MLSCPPTKIKHLKEINSTQKQILFPINQYLGFYSTVFTYVEYYSMVSLKLVCMCKYCSASVRLSIMTSILIRIVPTSAMLPGHQKELLLD